VNRGDGGVTLIDGDDDKTLAVVSDSDNDLLVVDVAVLRSRMCVIRKLSRSFLHLDINF